MDSGTGLQTTEESDALSVPRFLSLVSPNMKRVDPSLRPFAELALQRAGQELAPATRTEFAKALLPSLALVAPTGMTESDREEWLKAAWIALDGMPLDLLKRGCVAARFADHPAKLVPAILTEAKEVFGRRRANRSDILAAMAKMDPPATDEEPRCTPEEAARIIKETGLNMEGAQPIKQAMPQWMREAYAAAESEQAA